MKRGGKKWRGRLNTPWVEVKCTSTSDYLLNSSLVWYVNLAGHLCGNKRTGGGVLMACLNLKGFLSSCTGAGESGKSTFVKQMK